MGFGFIESNEQKFPLYATLLPPLALIELQVSKNSGCMQKIREAPAYNRKNCTNLNKKPVICQTTLNSLFNNFQVVLSTHMKIKNKTGCRFPPKATGFLIQGNISCF